MTPPRSTSAPPGPASADVRRFVRDLLSRSAAFHALPEAERQRLANGLVRVLAFVADPAAHQRDLVPVAAALEDKDATEKLKERLAARQQLVGKEFKGGASTEGAAVFKQLVQSVDFPEFVSGLIEGVFTSVVNSTIRQMQEYAKFLEAVVKSVEEFAKDHVSEGQARDFLIERFPRALTLEQSDPAAGPRLRLNPEEESPPDLKGFLGLQQDIDLEDEEGERRVVQAAQLRLARMRQQQLATMVLLGINRIVVTEGEIKASVLFDMRAKDTARRAAEAGMSDDRSVTATSSSRPGWGGFFGGTSSTRVETTVSSAYSNVRDQSAAELETKAKLSGNVVLKFKGDVYPTERLTSPAELTALQEKAQK